MMMEKIVKAHCTILALAFLCGCRPVVVPATNDPASDSDAILSGSSVISNMNVEPIVLIHTFDGQDRRILDIAFSARGEFIASSSQDMKIKLWDVRSRQKLHTFSMMSVDMADIDITSTGTMLASGEAIWNLESMQEVHSLERGSQIPAFIAFSPDGSLLALSRFDQGTRLLDVTSGQLVDVLPEQEEYRTKRMEFSPDGTLLAVGVMNGSVRVWDIQSRELVKILKYSGETDIHDIAFSPDGNFLASGGRFPAVILWDVRSGEVVRKFSVRDGVLNVAFSPDGTLLAVSGGYDEAVLLWDVESGGLLRSLPLEERSIAIAFSPDGRFLAAGCFDSQIYLWGIPANP